MIEIAACIQHRNYDTAASRKVPRADRTEVGARFSAALACVAQIPLIGELWIIRKEVLKALRNEVGFGPHNGRVLGTPGDLGKYRVALGVGQTQNVLAARREERAHARPIRSKIRRRNHAVL